MNKKKKNPKKIANLSLGVMGAGFLATLPFTSTTGMAVLSGGFEAGLVGGVADWFAVTAMFRHPLGIPIPHTALLPKNRDRVTQALLQMVNTQLLNKESMIEKIQQTNISSVVLTKVIEQLKKEETQAFIQEKLVTFLKEIDTKKTEAFIEEKSKEFVKSLHTEHLIHWAVDMSIANDLEEKLYGWVMEVTERKLNEESVKENIAQLILKSIQAKNENKLFGLAMKPLLAMGEKKVIETVDKTITEVITDLKREDSSNRNAILGYIRKELIEVKTNESILQKIEQEKMKWIDNYDVASFLSPVFEQGKSELIQRAADPIFLQEHLFAPLEKALLSYRDNQEKMDKLDTWFHGQLGTIIDTNHDKIGKLVKDNIEKLSTDELVILLEDKIGKDLTWIRVNGAVCGFLVGIVLTTFKTLI